MELGQYVSRVQTQLAAAAAIGDESARLLADALIATAEPAIRLAVLGAVTTAADDITSALLDWPGAPVVSVGSDGDDLRIEVRPSAPGHPRPEPTGAGLDEAHNTARISLRLPEALKSQIELDARRHGDSVNTWILRAATNALPGSARRDQRTAGWQAGTGHHVTGWMNG
jgi:hypothetical protein